jgi:predicted glycosyltransferase involved in capsule biosynthesis
VIDDYSPIKYSFPEEIQAFTQAKNSGPAKTRNRGKQIAIEKRSDIITFTDTDCIISKN